MGNTTDTKQREKQSATEQQPQKLTPEQEAAKKQEKALEFSKRLKDQQVKIKSDKHAGLWAFRDLLQDGQSLRNADKTHLAAVQKALSNAGAKPVGKSSISLDVHKTNLLPNTVTTLVNQLDASATNRAATAMQHILLALMPVGTALTAEAITKEINGSAGSKVAQARLDLENRQWFTDYLKKLHASAELEQIKKSVDEELKKAITDLEGQPTRDEDTKTEALRVLIAKLSPGIVSAKVKSSLSAAELELYENLRLFAQKPDAIANELQARTDALELKKTHICAALKVNAADAPSVKDGVAGFLTDLRKQDSSRDELLALANKLKPFLDAQHPANNLSETLLNTPTTDADTTARVSMNLKRQLHSAAIQLQQDIEDQAAALQAQKDKSANAQRFASLKALVGEFQQQLPKIVQQHSAQVIAAERVDADHTALNAAYSSLETEVTVTEPGQAPKNIPFYQAIINSKTATTPAVAEYYAQFIVQHVNFLLSSIFSNLPRPHAVQQAEIQALLALGIIEKNGNAWQLRKQQNADLATLEQIQKEMQAAEKKQQQLNEQQQRFAASVKLLPGFSNSAKLADGNTDKLDATDGKASNELIHEMAKAVKKEQSHTALWRWLQSSRYEPAEVVSYVSDNMRMRAADNYWRHQQHEAEHKAKSKSKFSSAPAPVSVLKELTRGQNSASFNINGLLEEDRNLPAKIMTAGLGMKKFAELSEQNQKFVRDMLDENIDVTANNWFAQVDLSDGSRHTLNAYELNNSDGSTTFYINVIDNNKQRVGITAGSNLEKYIAEVLVKGLAKEQATNTFGHKHNKYAVEFQADYNFAATEGVTQVKDAALEEKSPRPSRKMK